MDYPPCPHQYLTQSGNPSHSIVRTMEYVGLSNGLPPLSTPVPHTIRQSVPFHSPYYGIRGIVQWTTPLSTPVPHTIRQSVHSIVRTMEYVGLSNGLPPLSTPVPHTIRQSVPFHSPYYGIRGIVQWTTPLVHTSTSHNPAIRPIPCSQ